MKKKMLKRGLLGLPIGIAVITPSRRNSSTQWGAR